MKKLILIFSISISSSAFAAGWCTTETSCTGAAVYVDNKIQCAFHGDFHAFFDDSGACESLDIIQNSCVMPGLMCQNIMDICCTTGNYCGGTLICH